MKELLEFRNILENLYEGVYCVDLDRKIIFWNKGAERITGYSAAEVLGSSCSDNILVHVDGEGRNICVSGCPLMATIKLGKPHAEDNIFLHHKNGHRVPVFVSVSSIRDSHGRMIGAIEIFRENFASAYDVQYIEDLKKAALLDPLMEIPNRRCIESKLRAAIEEKRRFNISLGVLFIDIDHFKKVNDTYGHDAGDRVLKMVSKTLSSIMRVYNLIGRWGGEEFIGIITHVDGEGLRILAEKLRVLVENSFLDYNGNKIAVTVTIGGTISRGNESMKAILQRADAFLYKGKKCGRNCIMIDEDFSESSAPLR